MQPAISVIFCLLFFVFAPFGVKGQAANVENPTVVFPAASRFANTQLTYKIIPVANNTFCCDLLAGGKILNHQPSKPSLPRNEGLKSKEAA
jgi:hypothetical protein